MYFHKPSISFSAQNGKKVGRCASFGFNENKQSFRNNRGQKQKGVALITAMIITTIAVSLAGMVMYRQQLQIRLSSNISHLEQAYMYVYGMEDWAGTILLKSFEDHPDYDSLEDDWYAKGKLITFPIDGGTLNGQLIDLQGRINLNALNRTPPPKLTQQEINEGKERDPDIADINRLRLQNLINKVDPEQEMGPVENFTDILKDWIDKDETKGNRLDENGNPATGEGAETTYYQSLEFPYNSANTEMVTTTELRLLKDMKKKVYVELQKYVTALPIRNATGEVDTKLNVNTASEQVLETLGFTPNIIEEIVKERKVTPFNSKDNFLNFIVRLGLDKKEYENDIDVKSSYFLLKGRVTIINASIPVNSILERKNGKISVIMRDFSVQ